jgi:hypothetical protein
LSALREESGSARINRLFTSLKGDDQRVMRSDYGEYCQEVRCSKKEKKDGRKTPAQAGEERQLAQ